MCWLTCATWRGASKADLLGKFERAFARYREVWAGMESGHMWPFHGGGRLPTAALRANWLGEMLVHGYDVAAATGTDWVISEADAGDLLVLLMYQRLGLADAERAGLVVSGDRSAVGRLLGRFEKP